MVVKSILRISSVSQTLEPDSRILGGFEANPEEFPWFVTLNNGRTGDAFMHVCGGSYIGEGWILSAAHCIDERGNANFIKAGIQGSPTDEEHTFLYDYIPFTYKVMHPDYPADFEHYTDDIALIYSEELKELSLVGNDLPTASIFNLPEINLRIGTPVLTLGKGKYSTGSMSKHLKKYWAPIADIEHCEGIGMGFNAECDICHGDGDFHNNMVAFGDSGSPLCLDNHVYGIVSRLGKFGYDTLTRVSCYVDWINEVISNYPYED